MILLAQLVSFLARLFNLLILVRVLLSWVPSARDGALGQFIYAVTEPILGPIRSVIPAVGGLDLSPMAAMVLLEVVSALFIGLVR